MKTLRKLLLVDVYKRQAFDHPKRVYDEFIKEDYVVTPKTE